MTSSIDTKVIANLRTLSIDMVEAANSGHPGLPLGAAPLMHCIWDCLKCNPKNPTWQNRDRFVLSAGHGSALLYSMLHLAGFDLPLDELKNFRQLNSKTPGHPEYGHTVGVEATTGPLGHGFAMGVGMAIAEKMLGAHYNRPGFDVVDNYTYAIVSDGDLMEGVSSEAASLAGTLGLGKLIYLYDDNKITIEGNTDIAFKEDVQERFNAYGWHTLRVDDSEDVQAIKAAIVKAQKVTDKPSIIIIKTHIGFASPKVDTSGVHGEPLGKDGVAKTKENLGFNPQEIFVVLDEVKEYFDAKNQRLAKEEKSWQELFSNYKKEYPELAVELQARLQDDVCLAKDYFADAFKNVAQTATREASGVIMQKLAKLLPAFVGGSADLAPSNKTYLDGFGDFSDKSPQGRNIHFGVREHAMGAVVNGMALYGGFVPYCATFLVFADFLRPAMRLAALMGIKAVFVLTHDSIAVGEDGPTHQPIEHLASLRIIPNLTVLRPADALETVQAWRLAVNAKNPTALILTRQKLPVLHDYADKIMNCVQQGGYIINAVDAPAVTLLATGSEVNLALDAQSQLQKLGINANVVSMPSTELFEMQPLEYKKSVLPEKLPVLAIEAGVSFGWEKYADDVVAIDSFGASGPGSKVYAQFGFNVDNVVEKVINLIKK